MYVSDSSNIFRSYFSSINILVLGMNMKSGFIIRFFFVRYYFKRIIIISMLFSQKKNCQLCTVDSFILVYNIIDIMNYEIHALLNLFSVFFLK